MSSQAEAIDLKSILCRLSPEFLSAEKHLILEQWSGCLAQGGSLPQAMIFPRSPPILRSFLVRHLSDLILIVGSGSVTSGNPKVQDNPQTLCHFSPGAQCRNPLLHSVTPQLHSWPLTVTPLHQCPTSCSASDTLSVVDPSTFKGMKRVCLTCL